MVVIRLARGGAKKRPFYNVVVTDSRNRRDGRFIELLGTYHPITKVLKLDQERYQKWLKVGAQPSGTLAAVIRRTARAAKAA